MAEIIETRDLVVAAAGTVARDGQGRLLLVQRKDRTWAIPGGHLEAGETWRGCAEREFVEETGLAVAIGGLLGIYSDPTSQRQTAEHGGYQFVGVVFEGVVDGEPKRSPDDEILEVRYFTSADIPDELFGPDRPVIEDALSQDVRPFLR